MDGTGLTVDTLLGIRRPVDRVPLHLSPDGSMLALSSQDDRRKHRLGGEHAFTPDGMPLGISESRVVVVETATGRCHEPFRTAEAAWGAQWSPDGTSLAAYVKLEHESPCLGIWHRDRGRATPLRHAKVCPNFGFEVPRWTPDSRAVVVKLNPSGRPPGRPGANERRGLRVFSFDPTQPAPPRPPGWSEWYRCDLGLVDAGTEDVRTLSEGYPLTGWKVSPDGGAVAALTDREADLHNLYFDLVVMPLDGSESKVVATRVPQEYGISFNWAPDGERIAYLTEDPAGATRVFVAAADGSSAPVDVTGEDGIEPGEYLSAEYEAPRWGPHGERIYCPAPFGCWELLPDEAPRKIEAADRNVLGWVQRPTDPELYTSGEGGLLVVVRDPGTKSIGLSHLDLHSGESDLLLELDMSWSQSTFGVDVDGRRSLVYLPLEAVDRPCEIWRFGNLNRRAGPLLSLNPGLDESRLARSRLIEWPATDGSTRRGALLLPRDAEAHLPVPTIVEIYGGLLGSDQLHRFGCSSSIVNGHLLASHGYAVFYPDLPMEGRGARRELPELVLPAVRYLVESGVADPERLGVMGHSYGGFCVLALLTRTDVFRAAVSAAGMVNLTSFYGVVTERGDSQWTGQLESGLTGGSLWEKRDRYIDDSPLFFLDHVRTPVMLVSGTAHPEEPAQAGEAFSALRRLGKPVELRLYDGEHHWPGNWSEGSFRDLCGAVLEWFDTHLRG